MRSIVQSANDDAPRAYDRGWSCACRCHSSGGSGDPLALMEYLDRIGGDTRLNLLAGKAIGNRVIMPFDLDVVIQPGTPDTPFGEDIALDRQGPQSRTIEFLEQLTPRAIDPTQDPDVVEVTEQFHDRRIDLGETVKDAMAQPSQQPALDDTNRGLHFRLVCAAAAAVSEERRSYSAPPWRNRSC